MRAGWVFVFGVTTLVGVAARAGVPLVDCAEVYAGSTANPAAQYVIINNSATGNVHLLPDDFLRFLDDGGATVGDSTPPATTMDQPQVIFATAEAAALFGITADVLIPGAFINPSGGSIESHLNGSALRGGGCPAWGDGTIGAFPAGEALLNTTPGSFTPSFEYGDPSLGDEGEGEGEGEGDGVGAPYDDGGCACASSSSSMGAASLAAALAALGARRRRDRQGNARVR